MFRAVTWVSGVCQICLPQRQTFLEGPKVRDGGHLQGLAVRLGMGSAFLCAGCHWGVLASRPSPGAEPEATCARVRTDGEVCAYASDCFQLNLSVCLPVYLPIHPSAICLRIRACTEISVTSPPRPACWRSRVFTLRSQFRASSSGVPVARSSHVCRLLLQPQGTASEYPWHVCLLLKNTALRTSPGPRGALTPSPRPLCWPQGPGHQHGSPPPPLPGGGPQMGAWPGQFFLPKCTLRKQGEVAGERGPWVSVC